MRLEQVEIFSDNVNSAVLRHPERRFPGILVQGDTLYGLCQRADVVCQKLSYNSPGFDEMNNLRNALRGLLNHYKSVLGEHDLSLPFSE